MLLSVGSDAALEITGPQIAGKGVDLVMGRSVKNPFFTAAALARSVVVLYNIVGELAKVPTAA